MADDRHYAVIDTYDRKLTVLYEGKKIAETTDAFILKEVGQSVYNPVYYFPKESLTVELEAEPKRQSHCPIKGDASYWNLSESPTKDYFAWSYDNALPRAKKINGCIAFNPAYVSFLSEPT